MVSRPLFFLLLPSMVLAQDPSSPGRVQLLRLAPAFLVGAPSLADERPAEGETGPEWFALAFGDDNRLLDFRPHGEAGGTGYTRLFSQVQLFDDSRTACCLVLQAVTPSGLQFNGLPDDRGATVVTPALSILHTLYADGTALHLSFNKPLTLSNPAAQTLRREMQWGLGLHTPLSSDTREFFHTVHLSVEALGQWRRDPTTPISWDVMPGLHWKPSEQWRVSGGLVVPLEKMDTPWRTWQITAALQF